MSKRAGRHSQSSNDFLEPMAPTIDSVSDVGTNRPYNDGAATVSFTLPANSPEATGYTVLSSGSHTATGSSSPITITGLSSDTAYTFQVKATNAVGDSAYSTASSSILITTVPATPSAPSASSPSANQDEVSWSAPANGGKAISNYHWESDDGKSGDTAGTSVSVSQEAGTAQSYRVYATNANGNSIVSSWSGSVTTTFSFAPFGVFGFSPFGVFGFSPFGVFGFSPFSVFGFSPSCVDEDTLIATVGQNDTVVYKKAKEVNMGDEVWAPSWDELIDENVTNPQDAPYSQLSNLTTVKTTVMNIFPSVKPATMYFNNDIETRISLQQPVLVKRNNEYKFIESSIIEVGDVLLKRNEDGSYTEINVSKIDIIDEERTVYQFNNEPTDTFLASNLIVHNVRVGKFF